MPLNFPSFCDHFFAFKTAADYVYISESIESWEKYSKQRQQDKLPLIVTAHRRTYIQ